jgi:DNA-binding NarL/FixJ family response regulator
LKVLIAEDDRPMRELIKRIIGDLVDEFCECEGGWDAVAVYDAGRLGGRLPDWVLMDIRMKDGDGLAATQQIMRADPSARVIIVTSYNDASLREAARQAGARGYVLKENLLEIRQWLEPNPGSNANNC